jgi:hypothetical protein
MTIILLIKQFHSITAPYPAPHKIYISKNSCVYILFFKLKFSYFRKNKTFAYEINTLFVCPPVSTFESVNRFFTRLGMNIMPLAVTYRTDLYSDISLALKARIEFRPRHHRLFWPMFFVGFLLSMEWPGKYFAEQATTSFPIQYSPIIFPFNAMLYNLTYM